MQRVGSILEGALAGRVRSLSVCVLASCLGLSAGCADGPVAVQEGPEVSEPSFAVGDRVIDLGLESLPGPIPTYFSSGSRARAEQLQSWLRGADGFLKTRLKIDPSFSLAVLDEADWAAISPGPYGVPFAALREPAFVVLPAVPERSVVTGIYAAARSELPAGAAADLDRLGITYEEALGRIVDLIGFHEVGHIYIAELGYHKGNTARWLEELLATYAAYSYLDVAEPSSIVVWNALSEAMIGFVDPVSRSLDDFNTLYIQGLGPATYGWFQSHFNLRDGLVVQRRPRATWFRQLAAAGLDQDTRDIPTSELLDRLRGFMPSFTDWAAEAGLEYE